MTIAIGYEEVRSLNSSPHNARIHPKKQVDMLVSSIDRFGFNNPVLIDASLTIIAGHGRVEAAKRLGMTTVPCVRLEHMSEADKRAYITADNQLALKAGWDPEILAVELQYFVDLNFETQTMGFDVGEVELVLSGAAEAKPKGRRGLEDALPDDTPPAVTQRGDLYLLGDHRLLCGDALDPESFSRLMGEEQADVVFTDPPFNCPIDGFVGGTGRIKHREFAMAAGEMSEEEFTDFLAKSLGLMAGCMRDGAIAYVFMDWRHLLEVITAGRAAFTELKQLCVWNKTNGGQGTFYRSKHELSLVFKKGEAPHTNTFGLGEGGRYRTNVWDYAGVNSFRAGRMEDLAGHPTCKPVALIEDALKDVTRRGEIVLDGFAGSGSALIAAQKCGRRARLIEIDPVYCDLIVSRWEKYTGKTAVRQSAGLGAEVAA